MACVFERLLFNIIYCNKLILKNISLNFITVMVDDIDSKTKTTKYDLYIGF